MARTPDLRIHRPFGFNIKLGEAGEGKTGQNYEAPKSAQISGKGVTGGDGAACFGLVARPSTLHCPIAAICYECRALSKKKHQN